MQHVVANVSGIRFEIENALENQLGAQPLPFPGMDKSGSAICTFFIKSICSKGTACPFRHVKGDRTVVCKHWLRGLCKKGDDCEFLHEYDMSKMPECYFFSKFGQCSNRECPFLHIDPEKKIRDCAWYDRGFCRHGPNCKNRHTRRVLCVNYLCGFCPDGPNCKFVHATFELPTADAAAQLKKATIQCHYCQETGHKAVNCPKMPPGVKLDNMQGNFQKIGSNAGHGQPQGAQQYFRQNFNDGGHMGPKRPLDEVTCFKCGEKGHYANKCPKGHLAFLSNAVI